MRSPEKGSPSSEISVLLSSEAPNLTETEAGWTNPVSTSQALTTCLFLSAFPYVDPHAIHTQLKHMELHCITLLFLSYSWNKIAFIVYHKMSIILQKFPFPSSGSLVWLNNQVNRRQTDKRKSNWVLGAQELPPIHTRGNQRHSELGMRWRAWGSSESDCRESTWPLNTGSPCHTGRSTGFLK